MADQTIAEALAHAPASTEKTNLDTALDTLYALPAAQVTAGAITDNVARQLESQIRDLAEEWATELKDHS